MSTLVFALGVNVLVLGLVAIGLLAAALIVVPVAVVARVWEEWDRSELPALEPVPRKPPRAARPVLPATLRRRVQVLARAQWRCQACRVRTRLEVHHVVKRAQGGSDFDRSAPRATPGRMPPTRGAGW